MHAPLRVGRLWAEAKITLLGYWNTDINFETAIHPVRNGWRGGMVTVLSTVWTRDEYMMVRIHPNAVKRRSIELP